MWTAANRKGYERKGLRYPSDMTDAEWALVEPLVDVPQRGQGRRRVDLREVLNAVFYVLETGCQWRALPRDLPPRSTVHNYFIRWQCDRTLIKLFTSSTCRRANRPAFGGVSRVFRSTRADAARGVSLRRDHGSRSCPGT